MIARPTPTWYDDAKLGIFVHWGLYSVPGWAPTIGTLDEVGDRISPETWFKNNPYAEWYANTLRIADSPTAEHHRQTYGDAPYEAFIPAFNEAIQRWDPDAFAEMVKNAGARYVVPTTKHHDGFCLWPTRVPHPTLGDFHASRDLVGEMAAAVRTAGLRFGTYYSGGLDWTFNPKPITNVEEVGNTVLQDPAIAAYFDAHWQELIDRYDIDIMWNDIGYPTVSGIKEIIEGFYAAKPDGLINDRFKERTSGEDVSPLPPDYVTPEYRSFHEIQAQKWEACRGIGYSFGYNQNEDDTAFLAPDELVRFFVDVVSKNGNLLLNVGPHADGSVQEAQQIRLRALGAWLAVNGEAIYGTRPWVVADGQTANGIPVRFTQKDGDLYAILLDQPKPGSVVIDSLAAGDGHQIHLLGRDGPLTWNTPSGGLQIDLPGGMGNAPAHAIRISPAPRWIGEE